MAAHGWPSLLVLTWKNVHLVFPPDSNLTAKATFSPLPVGNQTQGELFKPYVTHILRRITFWPFRFRSRMRGVALAETASFLPYLMSLTVAEIKQTLSLIADVFSYHPLTTKRAPPPFLFLYCSPDIQPVLPDDGFFSGTISSLKIETLFCSLWKPQDLDYGLCYSSYLYIIGRK